MKRTIKVARPSSGSGTIVTVTLVRNGVTVTYALRTMTTAVGASVKAATSTAKDMLSQAEAEIEREAAEDGSVYEG